MPGGLNGDQRALSKIRLHLPQGVRYLPDHGFGKDVLRPQLHDARLASFGVGKDGAEIQIVPSFSGRASTPCPRRAKRRNAAPAARPRAEVRVVREDLLYGSSSANQTGNHAHGDPHAPDGGLATHYPEIMADAVKLSHETPRVRLATAGFYPGTI